MTTQEKTEKEAIAHLKTLNKADLLKFSTQNVGKIIGTVTNEHDQTDKIEELTQDATRLRQELKDAKEEIASNNAAKTRAFTTKMPELNPNQINGFLNYDAKMSTDKKSDILSTRGQQKCHLNIRFDKEVSFKDKDGNTITKTVEINETRKIWLQIGSSANGYWFSGNIWHDDAAPSQQTFIKPRASSTESDFIQDEDGNQTPSNG